MFDNAEGGSFPRLSMLKCGVAFRSEVLMSPRIVYSTDPAPVSCASVVGASRASARRSTCRPISRRPIFSAIASEGPVKTVTLVWGLQHNPAVYKALLKTLQTMCGTGGTFKDGEIEIQGDHRERVAEKLKEMGYKVKMVGG